MDHKQIGEALWAADGNVLPKPEQPLVHRMAAEGVFQKIACLSRRTRGQGAVQLTEITHRLAFPRIAIVFAPLGATIAACPAPRSDWAKLIRFVVLSR
jgi:hypothetical protein